MEAISVTPEIDLSTLWEGGDGLFHPSLGHRRRGGLTPAGRTTGLGR